jgi:hypothetical protein
MDLDQNFTATRLKRRINFSFSLTIFLVAGLAVLTNAASVAYGQVGILKPVYSIILRPILQETQPR